MSTINCQCGSDKKFEQCCEPFLKGKAFPETAEQLMRSRYTAFTLADVEYIRKTLAPESRGDFDVASTTKWAKDSQWNGLTIISTKKGTANDHVGTVEFTAVYEQEGQAIEHHEVSEFNKNEKGHWQFLDGESHTHKAGEGHHTHDGPKQLTVLRAAPKVGRNDPCPCGSGKKYKKCCESNP